MYRQQLNERRDKFKMEYDKAKVSLELLLENVDKLLDFKDMDNSSLTDPMLRCKNHMEILRRLDSYTYPVIEFNAHVDMLVSPVSKISEVKPHIETENTLSSNTVNSNMVCDNIVEISSNTDDLISKDDHNHSIISNLKDDACEISGQVLLDIDEDFSSLVTYVESPSYFYVVRECSKYEIMKLGMLTHYSESLNRISCTKKELMSNKRIYFACLHKKSWFRGKLTNNSHTDDHIEVFLLDIGDTVKIHLNDIQPLKEQFCSVPPLAYLCHLSGVQPLPGDNGEWSKEAIDFMKNLCDTSCIITVSDNSTKSLEVCLLTMESIAVNVQLIDDDFAVFKENCLKSDSITVDPCVKSTKLTCNQMEKTMPKLTSPQQNNTLFKMGEELECYILSADSPSMFYVILQKNQQEFLSMMENMMTVCETNKTMYMSKREIIDNETDCYACPFREEWMRGIIHDPLSQEPDHVMMFLIDMGVTVKYHFSEIMFLNQQFYVLGPQAHHCHLFQIKPFSNDSQDWSQNSKDFMLQVQDSIVNIIVASIDDKSLGVYLKLYNGSILNNLMVEKCLAKVIENYPETEDFPMEFPEMAPSDDLFQDYLTNLQGFSSKHEMKLCKFYTGPPSTTCFKGSQCKMIHQLPNKNGWTIQKLPEGHLPRNVMVLPCPNSMVGINVTAIKSCATFYGHVLYFESSSDTSQNLKVAPKTRQPEELTDLMDRINSEQALKSLMPLSSPPCYGLLLLCYVSSLQKWFRAVILDIDETYLATVFLVDYGITEYKVEIRKMRKLDGVFSQLPFQAIELSLANGECDCVLSRECHDGMNALAEASINKNTTGFVVSSNTEQVEVVLYGEDFVDIGEELCQNGLLKPVKYTVQEWKDNSEMSDNVIKKLSKYQKHKPQSSDEILFGVKSLGIVPAAP